MLKITVPASELWDEEKEEFVSTEEMTLRLEHSLVSLSKWESKWCKPFFSKEEKTQEETIDYIRCMVVDENVDENVINSLTYDNVTEINEYIGAPMTATWFSDKNNKGSSNREQITSELVYYWMVALTIPWEAQYWHLNRLITLIKICQIKNEPEKKMNPREVMSRNAALNAARRKKFNSKG